MILNMLGYVTREAEDGPSALQVLAKDDSIDLLFTDVVMPKGMNGFQLAEEATRHHGGLRVLLTSGYPETELEKSGWSDSKFRLLNKPYSNEALSKAMQALFDE